MYVRKHFPVLVLLLFFFTGSRAPGVSLFGLPGGVTCTRAPDGTPKPTDDFVQFFVLVCHQLVNDHI